MFFPEGRRLGGRSVTKSFPRTSSPRAGLGQLQWVGGKKETNKTKKKEEEKKKTNSPIPRKKKIENYF